MRRRREPSCDGCQLLLQYIKIADLLIRPAKYAALDARLIITASKLGEDR